MHPLVVERNLTPTLVKTFLIWSYPPSSPIGQSICSLVSVDTTQKRIGIGEKSFLDVLSLEIRSSGTVHPNCLNIKSINLMKDVKVIEKSSVKDLFVDKDREEIALSFLPLEASLPPFKRVCFARISFLILVLGCFLRGAMLY